MPTKPSRRGSAQSPNFGFLTAHSPLLADHAAKAERYVFDDPNTALIKLRQFAELLAQQTAAYAGVRSADGWSLLDLLRHLQDARVVTFEVSELFHAIRRIGNRAVHGGSGSKREALHQLRLARRLAIWFHQAFQNPSFRPAAFLPPPEPQLADASLAEELADLHAALAAEKAKSAELEQTAQQHAEELAAVKEQIAQAYEELDLSLQLGAEAEEQLEKLKSEHEANLQKIHDQAAAYSHDDSEKVIGHALTAATNMVMDEAETRMLIDEQLKTAGWKADSVALRYSSGARPAKGLNQAIAEWPTGKGPADYVLFAGLRTVGVVEAKKASKNASSAVAQAAKYSIHYEQKGSEQLLGPWGSHKVPFLFGTNGRPYKFQHKHLSGIWFRDARRKTSHMKALPGWHTPEGLLKLLEKDIEAADAALKASSSDYLPLRDYQRDAIAAVEAAISEGKDRALLAMATGTGKTRTAMCLMYRLLKSKRFHRILFLVDRTLLGEQAFGAFSTQTVEQGNSLASVYEVKELGDITPETDTRVHVATIQSMVKRVLAANPDNPVPVDQYDCIIVDECHRGYVLDRDMSEPEFKYRSQDDYISKYRRVLEHFDAVMIGLTATPALHTVSIFGQPVFEYRYPAAVIDGHLADHEPPVRITTKLSKDGIKWEAGDEVTKFNTATLQEDLFEAPDEITIDVEGFNTRVYTESFNDVVCTELAKHIDPRGHQKTLVFCTTDAHADMVAQMLTDAFEAQYGQIDDETVLKLTGNTHELKRKLLAFRNERLPSVAVTVDLLTTGLNVPAITNLVFLRRVKSRILYEQMLGRATRLCPDIGKEAFRIFDAVDLYSDLHDFNTMRPVVVNPGVTFKQLAKEVCEAEDEQFRLRSRDQFVAKLHAKKRNIVGKKLEAFVALADSTPDDVASLLKNATAEEVKTWLLGHSGLADWLDDVKGPGGKDMFLSDHADEHLETTTGYGESGAKPEDYLTGFKKFIQTNKNSIDALQVVMQRPKDLTRAQLRELKVKLEAHGYSERLLQGAVAQVTNKDVAASIIGFVRQQALGSPLVAYKERVHRAVDALLAREKWTAGQRQWLERIRDQLLQETVVDKAALDQGAFRTVGGFKTLNNQFGGKLESLLGDLHEEVWRDVG